MNLDFLKAPAAIAPMTDSAEVDKSYRYWRVRTMYAMFIGYAVFYFCRKNLYRNALYLVMQALNSGRQVKKRK